MMYMLDTNICIYIMRKQPVAVLRRLEQSNMDAIAISAITVSELVFGAFKSRWSERNIQGLEQFLKAFTVYPYDQQAAWVYGQLRTDLERNGTPISNADMLIAAHAISQNMTLVTNNEREFVRIPNLRVENWA